MARQMDRYYRYRIEWIYRQTDELISELLDKNEQLCR